MRIKVMRFSSPNYADRAVRWRDWRLIEIKARTAKQCDDQQAGRLATGTKMIRRSISIPIASAICAATVVSAYADSLVAQGKALVETNCARCHAIGATDTSSHPDAPAFRTLSQRYPVDQLAEALAEGISTGHPDMPEFVASPQQIDAILAYIGSLQSK